MSRLAGRGRPPLPGAASLALASALVVVLVVAACGDSTGPDSPIRVQVAVEQTSGPAFAESAEGQPLITCGVELTATASGTGSAAWQGALVRFFAGSQRSEAVDSAKIAAGDIGRAWGGAEIAVGETQASSWTFTAGIPFGVTVDFRYRATEGGAEDVARATFDCGPEVPADAPPPSITAVTVQPESGEVDAGSIVRVHYTAESSVGLWQTMVELSGACEARALFAEHLAPSVTRSAELTLPAGCRSNADLAVTVYALDALAQERSQRAATLRTVPDGSRPEISILFFPPAGGSATTEIAGEYFAGDSLHLVFNASDNSGLAALVWEVLPFGVRDSLVVSGPGANEWMKIPLRPEWSGPIQLRLYARDAAKLTSDVVESAPGALQIHPTVERPTRWTTVPGEIRDFAIDARRGAVYLAQGNEHRIAVLSTSSMTVTRTIQLSAVPTDLDLTPGGDSLIVAIPYAGAIGILDLRDPASAMTMLPLDQLDPSLEQRPWRVRVAANGRAFVSVQGNVPHAWTLLEVDLASGAQRFRTDAGDGGYVGGGLLERSHDGSVIVMNGGPDLFQRYDAVTDRFGPRRSAIPYDWLPSVDGYGIHTAIGLDLYGETLLFLRRAEATIGGGVPRTALAPNGEHLYTVHWGRGIIRSRVSDGAIVDRTLNPVKPGLIRVSADGTLLVTAEQNYGATSAISVIDLR